MLSLANSINRLNLLFQQSRFQESLNGQATAAASAAASQAAGGSPPPSSHLEQGIALRRPHIVTGTPQTVFLADLPKDISSVELYDFLKQQVGEAEIVIKRPMLKYFYYAFCRFPDIIQARKLTHDIKFPTLNGVTCRALPYDKELLRANCPPGSNVFVKNLPKDWTHKELHEAFQVFGEIVSARVSIKEDYGSRGFGFVAYTSKAAAEKACNEMDGKQLHQKNSDNNHDESPPSDDSNPPLSVQAFVPRSERQPRQPDSFTNLFVKNFPPSTSDQPYSEADLRAVFSPYGPITSCKVDDSGAFGFVCFEDPDHAARALSDLGTSTTTSQSQPSDTQDQQDSQQQPPQAHKLYVAKMQNKEVREKLLRIEMLKSARQMAKQNLYFKGFSVEDCDSEQKITELEEELKEYFSRFGEVKNLKLVRKAESVVSKREEGETQLSGFGFVSFQTLEAAQKCRFEASKELFRDQHKLYVNQFEWKELRQAHKMERIDQIELGRYLRQERAQKSKQVLDEVREDLATDQGQLLLRVLKMLTQINEKQAQERQRAEANRLRRRSQNRRAPSGARGAGSRGGSRSVERAPLHQNNFGAVVDPAQQLAGQQLQAGQQPQQQQAMPQQQPRNFNDTIMGQAYAVRFQTLITSQLYIDADEVGKKQHLGTFMYEHVRSFIEQAALVSNHDLNQARELAPKITGMVMSLPLQNLMIDISTQQGLFDKVHQAMSLLRRNSEAQQQQAQQQQNEASNLEDH